MLHVHVYTDTVLNATCTCSYRHSFECYMYMCIQTVLNATCRCVYRHSFEYMYMCIQIHFWMLHICKYKKVYLTSDLLITYDVSSNNLYYCYYVMYLGNSFWFENYLMRIYLHLVCFAWQIYVHIALNCSNFNPFWFMWYQISWHIRWSCSSTSDE